MSFDRYTDLLDYDPCTYGVSRTMFRGPAQPLEAGFTAVLGGSEAFGKYIEDPFSDRLGNLTHRRVINFGVQNGSLDVFAQDAALMPVLSQADTVVVQAMGAANISNRFYSVHPRRNDRFLRHSILMETLFQDIDFSEFAFTRHMLCALRDSSPEKFAIVTQELAQAWIARMRLLLTRVPGRKVLLWIERPPQGPLGPEPLFVTVEMLQTLEPLIDNLVHCEIEEETEDHHLAELIFPETERASALASLSGRAHEQVARALARTIGRRDGLAA
ncbi:MULTISPECIES: DUF6473 family protein [Jannaschia]|nr:MULTISPECIES: DUF6473 family protein [unclassified Jannaschia]